MRIIKVDINSVSPRQGITAIISNAKEALRKFCTNQMLVKKLVPKSFTFQFDFHDGRRTIGKSVDRFMMILKRAVQKKLPFLEHTSEDTILTNTGEGISIKIVLPQLHYLVAESLSSTPGGLNEAGEKYKRYVHYINYLSRKNKVPVSMTIIVTWAWVPGEEDRCRNMSKAEKSNPKTGPKYTPVIHIRIKPSKWEWIAPLNVMQMIEKDHGGIIPDRYLATRGDWTSTPLRETSTSNLDMDCTNEINVPERMFLFTDQIIKVIVTIVRNVQYAHTAFSFRAEEQPTN